MTRSQGSGLVRARSPGESPRSPSSLCTVRPAPGSRAATSAPGSRPGIWAASDCASRAAALPVGAAKQTRASGRRRTKATSRRASVVVLPVPGPPETRVRRRVSAVRTAWRWASACGTFGKSEERVASIAGSSAAGLSSSMAATASASPRSARKSLRR